MSPLSKITSPLAQLRLFKLPCDRSIILDRLRLRILSFSRSVNSNPESDFAKYFSKYSRLISIACTGVSHLMVADRNLVGFNSYVGKTTKHVSRGVEATPPKSISTRVIERTAPSPKKSPGPRFTTEP
jgi:hypothetical protein